MIFLTVFFFNDILHFINFPLDKKKLPTFVNRPRTFTIVTYAPSLYNLISLFFVFNLLHVFYGIFMCLPNITVRFYHVKVL